MVGAEANAAARLTFGRKISQDLEFTYSTNLANTQEQVIVLEYSPRRDVQITTSRDEDGSVAVDLRYTRRF